MSSAVVGSQETWFKLSARAQSLGVDAPTFTALQKIVTTPEWMSAVLDSVEANTKKQQTANEQDLANALADTQEFAPGTNLLSARQQQQQLLLLLQQQQGQGQQQPVAVVPPTLGQVASAGELSQPADDSVDETVDDSGQGFRRAATAGLIAGLGSMAMQQGLQMVLQSTLTSMLTLGQNEAQSAFNQMVNLTITQNPNLLQGWIWVCGSGACIACLEMDGSIHGNDEDMSSHVNCQCVQAAYNGPLPDDFLTGDQWFNQQDEAIQEEILGPSKFAAWQAGDVQLMDFMSSEGGYIHERSLKSLGLDYRSYLQNLPRKSDFTAEELQRAMEEATAPMRVVEPLEEEAALAFAPEFPEIPGIGEEVTAEAIDAIKAQEKYYNDIFMGPKIIAQDEAAAAIVQRLPADFDYAALREAMHITPEQIALLQKARMLGSTASDLDRYTIFHLLQEYHTFAGGTATGTPLQIMLQEAVQREFGLTSVEKYWTADKLALALEQYGEVIPEFQQVMRAMYDNTQAWFQERGITEVALYRGESWTTALRPKDFTYDRTIRDQELILKPLSSWSTSLKVGSEYAQGEGDVALKAYGAIEHIQMPVEQILSVPGTGFGNNSLQELLVLGDKYDAEVLALKTTAGSLLSHDAVYDAFAEAAAQEATRATTEESAALQQMRADREALQSQRDAIQAKQDVLSARWAKIVRETDFTEPDEAAAAEKKLAAIEKQQAANIKKMDALDRQMKEAILSEASGKTPEELQQLKATMTDLQKQLTSLMQEHLKIERSREMAEYKLGSRGYGGLQRDLEIATQRAMRDLQNQAFEDALAKAPTADDALSKAVTKAQAKYDKAQEPWSQAIKDQEAARLVVKDLAAQGLGKGDTVYDDAVVAKRAADRAASKTYTAVNRANLDLNYAKNELQRAVFATVKEEDVANVKSVVALQKKIDALQKKIDAANARVEELNAQIRDVSSQRHETYLESRGGLLPYSAADARAPFSDTLDIPPPQTGRGGFPIQKPNDLMKALDYSNKIETDVESKVRISYELGSRLENNDAFMKMADDLGRATAGQDYPLFYGAAVGQPLTADQLAGFLVSNWGGGFDASSDIWYAMQRAASDEFGIGATIQRSDEAQKMAGEAYYAQYGEALRGWQRAMYDSTQQWFADHNISEVEVFRGFAWDTSEGTNFVPRGINWGQYGAADSEAVAGVGEMALSLNPMSSFSADPGIASSFGGRYSDLSMVVGAKVPVGRILSSGQTGLGAKFESELVVLGSAQGDLVKYEAVAKDLAAYEAVAETVAESAAAAAGDMGAKALSYVLPEIDQQAEAAVIQAAQDVLDSADGVASHTDAIDLGASIHDYIDERIGPLAGYANESFSIAGKPLADLTPEQLAWYKGDNSAHGGMGLIEVQYQYQAALKQETLRLMEQVRDVGGDDLTILKDAKFDQQVADAFAEVEKMLPTDWIAASNDQGGLFMERVRSTSQRGYYDAIEHNGSGILTARYTKDTDPQELLTTAAHESGHRMADAVDGIWLMEQDFYNARTAGEDWIDLSADLGVKGRTKLDQWAFEYLGKEPIVTTRPRGLLDAGGNHLRTIKAYELLSSGLEWVLGSDVRGAYFLSQDEEFHKFILGLLFGAKDHVV